MENNNKNIVDILLSLGFAFSKAEARRLVIQGVVSVDAEKVTDQNSTISTGSTVTVGRHRKGIVQ